MEPSKKPSLAVAIGVPRAPMDDDAPDGEDADIPGAKMEAAKALIDAVKAGDVAAVNDALTTHARLCGAEPPPDDGEEG